METYSAPSRCIIETAYLCNLKCQSCSLWKEDYRKLRGEEKGTMTKPQLETLHKKLADSGVKRITYIGGEPFLNKELTEIALNAGENGLIPSAVTNGNALTTAKIEELTEKKIFNTIIFSIDGPRNIHNFIRGKNDAFEKAFEALLLLSKLKARKKLKYPRIFIYTTVSKLNYEYLEEIYRLAKSVNANRLRFQLASSISREIIDKTNETLGFEALKTHSYINGISPSAEELGKAKKLIRKIKNLSKTGLRIETEKILEGKENKSCVFIGKDFVITPSGNVLVCPMLTNFIAGNIMKEKPENIFRGNAEKTREILTLANSGRLPICSQCCVEKII